MTATTTGPETAVHLESAADLSLANAERVAFEGAGIAIGEKAKQAMRNGRLRFERYLAGPRGRYVYGSTTAPGSRAKVVLSAPEAARQSETVGNFLLLQPGLGGEMLPERCVRLAVFARLANALSNHGKLRPETAEAIAQLVEKPPCVPMRTATCSGEVIPLTWLVAPLATFPLAVGEAMALVNGSPFASAMVTDVALTLTRRLRLAEVVFALSAEAAGCPSQHFDARLADHWRDPYYLESLRGLGVLLDGSRRVELTHQAPTCWRVLPQVLGCARQAAAECAATAAISLGALKDNPTFLFDAESAEAGGPGADGAAADAVASSGGYHDHRAAKAIDAANNVMLDVGVLASRHIARLLDGEGLGLPPLLAMPGDLPGVEYLAWGLTEPLAAARRAAEPTTLDMGQHDPAGNQSDVVGLAQSAYAKHREAARSFDDCMAALAVVAILALDCRGTAPYALPVRLEALCEPLMAMERAGRHRVDACGEPLRRIRETLRRAAEELPGAEFEALF